MRKSRLSRFNDVKAQLIAISDEFINNYFPNGKPSVFYEIQVNYTKFKEGYHILECPVRDIHYYWKLPYFNGRPSESDIEKAMEMLECDLKPQLIFIATETADHCSWAHPVTAFDDFESGRRCSFSREKLEPELASLIDTFVPKEGQFKCRYCGKATDNASKVVGTIIARQYPGMRASFDYCSKTCHSYDQMGHEG